MYFAYVQMPDAAVLLFRQEMYQEYTILLNIGKIVVELQIGQ